MNRKQLIEKVILKELRDIEFMKKVKNINFINEAKRPEMTGAFGAKVTAELAKLKAENEKTRYVNPDVLSNNPVQDWQVLRNAEEGKANGGDSSLENDINEPTMGPVNAEDAEEDTQARAALEKPEKPVKDPEAQVDPIKVDQYQIKNKNIEDTIRELGQHIPEFAELGSTKGKTPKIFDTKVMEINKIIRKAHKSHPHLRPHLTKLRTLLGM